MLWQDQSSTEPQGTWLEEGCWEKGERWRNEGWEVPKANALTFAVCPCTCPGLMGSLGGALKAFPMIPTTLRSAVLEGLIVQKVERRVL